MHSVRTKITALTMAVILLSIVLIFVSGYLVLRGEIDQRAVQILNLIDGDTQKSLEKYFASVEQSVGIAADIAESTLTTTSLTDDDLARYCRDLQKAFADLAGYTNGVISYFYCISPDVSQTVHGFFYLKGETGEFEEQAPIDARELYPKDSDATAWYYKTIEHGRPFWIGPYTEQYIEGTEIFSYLVPIYKGEVLIGVLGMDIPFEVLVGQVRPIRVYNTGYACLLDSAGQILYHPTLPRGRAPEEFEHIIGSEIFRDEDNSDELIRYMLDGEERQLSFSTLPNGIKLIISVPTKEIQGTVMQLIRNIILITAAILVVFTIFLLVVLQIHTRPLQQLTEASRKLSAGDYGVELPFRGIDEIGELTGAFTQMRDQLKHTMDDLHYQMFTDKLTGLPNMRSFFRLANAELQQMRENGKHPVMLFIDLVGMKHFNRQYGFEEGDKLIRAFAEILSRRLSGHNVCRFSADHFVAVEDEETVEESLQAIFQEFQRANSGNTLPVRVGIYPYRLGDVPISVACDRAKSAGDQSKGSYLSSFHVYDETTLKLDEDYRYIINNLDRALSEGWIRVYYQPIIRASNGQVCDEEALARWFDPVLGSLSPAEFIPALEEAKLIYKLDLYVVDQVLEKIRRQREAGLYVVPQSINLSRADFDSCDIVEEICRRADSAGIDRSLLTIEITESVIGSDFEFMKGQVMRFQKLGFHVWMDDFGSGYSSLDVLQNIHFDLIKFDMRFMDRFSSCDESKIILTELTKMAIGLGVETVCEGVEQLEQAEFLREIGCTRIQGYYFGKPIPFEEILTKYRDGADMGFENPEESEYYASIGRINLYDLTVVGGESDESLSRYFDTLPMSILEVNGMKVRYNRCNKSFRDFMKRSVGREFTTEEMDFSVLPEGPASVFLNAVIRCSKDGSRSVVDGRLDKDTTVHMLVQRVAVNPVTGTTAVAAAVLAVIRENENAGTNYAHIAKALSADYVNLYYVNLETGTFIEYSPDAVREDLALERHGDKFFETSRADALTHIYKDDQEYFINSFTKENIEQMLDTQGSFTLTYRLLIAGTPTYVNMKAVRMQEDSSHIIIGVNNVDMQVREKEALARIQAEQTTYARIEALTQGIICIYTVDPATSHYSEYSASGSYAARGVPKEGEDFFAQSKKEALKHVYPEDIEKFQTLLTRERILNGIEQNGFYSFRYRMILDDEPKYCSISAAMIEEQDGPQIILGITNIDAQVRREQAYEQKLSAARSRANLDTLTGVKNKIAYNSMSESLSRQIEGGQNVRYAIVLCCVNDLEHVNNTEGREAGDQLIRDACAVICDIFKHSPVFRVAGDQFAVIAQAHDYEHIESLVEELNAVQRGDSGDLLVVCGMAKYDGKESVAHVFGRADHLCREKRQELEQQE